MQNIKRQDVQLLTTKYPELKQAFPHIYQDLEQRQKFYLDIIYNLLSKNKQLHYQANANYHSFKQKQAEVASLQLRLKEPNMENSPSSRSIIINYITNQRLPVIEEEPSEKSSKADSAVKMRMPMETKRSVVIEEQPIKQRLGQVANISKRLVTERSIQTQPNINEDVSRRQVEQYERPGVTPAMHSAKQNHKSNTHIEQLKYYQQPTNYQQHVPNKPTSLPSDSSQSLPSSANKKTNSIPQIPEFNTPSFISHSQVPSPTYTKRKLDYRCYLNDFEEMKATEIASGTHSVEQLTKNEYLTPVAQTTQLIKKTNRQSAIQKLKQDNRRILKRLEVYRSI